MSSSEKKFKITTGTVSPEEALRYADELEKDIGEVMAGKRKAGAIRSEPMCRLIQFVRDNARVEK